MKILFDYFSSIFKKTQGLFQSNKNSTENAFPLTQLDKYSFLSVLDYTAFDEMIHLAGTNTEIRQIITDHFMIAKYHIHEKVIRVEGAGHWDRVGNDIIIGNYSKALPFLRIFGHKITKLRVVGDHYSLDVIGKICEYVARYCSKTIIELDVINTDDYLTVRTWETFTKATKVYFDRLRYVDNIQIQRIYPAAKELLISLDPAVDGSNKYVHHYPIQIRNLIRAMPELHTLDVHLPTFDMLTVVKASMPYLESLSISYFVESFRKSVNQIMHFEKIKDFEVRVKGKNSIGPLNSLPITFDNLETLAILSTRFDSIPLNLIEENVNLKKISLPYTFPSISLLSLVARISHSHQQLEELHLLWTDLNTDADMFSVLTALDRLKKIIFIVLVYNNGDLAGDRARPFPFFIDIIPPEWQVGNITKVIVDSITFHHVPLVREDRHITNAD